jgi:hypothetical protein
MLHPRIAHLGCLLLPFALGAMQHFRSTPPGLVHAPYRRAWRCLFPRERNDIMRTRIAALLLAPLLLLAAACTEQIVTAPPEALLSTGSSETVSYQAILLADRYGHAHAISDAGIVVGDILEVAVRWVVSNVGITGPEELGTLPGRYADSHQQALAVNGSGVIVGYAHSKSHGTEGAFVYTDELGMQLLRGTADGTWRRRAVAVTDQGVIAGWIDFVVRDEDGTIIDRAMQGAVWLDLDAEPLLLPPLEDHEASRAVAINTSGLVTGYSRPSFDSEAGEVGVAWRINDEGQLLEGPYPLDAGFRPGAWAASFTWPVSGNSLNEAGDMVGWQYSAATNWSEAAFLRGGNILLLGSLLPDEMSYAMGITDPSPAGVVQVVGASGWAGSVATLWTVDADDKISAVDLGAPPRSINASASGINAQGWIAGRSASRIYSRRPTLWMPQESSDPCNPHPRTGACRG